MLLVRCFRVISRCRSLWWLLGCPFPVVGSRRDAHQFSPWSTGLWTPPHLEFDHELVLHWKSSTTVSVGLVKGPEIWWDDRAATLRHGVGGSMPRPKEAGTTQLQLVVSGNLSEPVVPMTISHEILEMHTFIRNRLIFRMVCGLDEMTWQALFTGEPVY